MSKKKKRAPKDPAEVGFDIFGSEKAREKFAVNDYISTGSYNLNRIISGSLFGGIAEKRITGLIGEEAVGKTLFALCAAREAQKKGYIVAFFDTEGCLTPEFAENSGIDLDTFLYKQVATIEDFRRDSLKLIDWKTSEHGAKKKMLIILDSYGGLTARKFINDVESGKDTMDMGIFAKIAKATFKMLGFSLAPHNITFIYTNHITTDMGGYIPRKVQTGGMAAKYYPSTIVMLRKKIAKDGDDAIGLHIKAQTIKSRLVPPMQVAEIFLDWQLGLDPTAGLFDISVAMGFIENPSQGYYVFAGTDKKLRKKECKEMLKTMPDVISQLEDKIQELGFKTIEPTEEQLRATVDLDEEE